MNMIPVLLPGFDLTTEVLRGDAWPDALHHLLRVRRVRAGQRLLLSNGAGHRATAKVLEANKQDIILTDLEILPAVPQPRVHLWLCVLEKSALEEACHLVSQVGVAAIHLVHSDFVVAQPPRAKEIARLEKIILNSCIQSEQAWLPELHPEPVPLKDLPLGLDWCVAMERQEVSGEPAANVLIGPEGGWSPAERERLKGMKQLHLGPSILRAQTAALVSCWQAARHCGG